MASNSTGVENHDFLDLSTIGEGHLQTHVRIQRLNSVGVEVEVPVKDEQLSSIMTIRHVGYLSMISTSSTEPSVRGFLTTGQQSMFEYEVTNGSKKIVATGEIAAGDELADDRSQRLFVVSALRSIGNTYKASQPE